MSPDPDLLLARVRALALALALPETAERPSHGSPGFHIVKGKFFAYFWHGHHGDGETVVIVKTGGFDEQAMLIEMDSDCYSSRRILARPAGWPCGSTARTSTGTVSPIASRAAGSWSRRPGCWKPAAGERGVGARRPVSLVGGRSPKPAGTSFAERDGGQARLDLFRAGTGRDRQTIRL